MSPYPLERRTWLGAGAAGLAIVIAALGLLGIAPASPVVFFVCVLLVALACLL